MSVLTARDREVLRGALLARLGARHAAAGAELDTREGTDAWQLTAALAVLLSALEGQAQSGVLQLLPDRAVSGYLDAHGVTAELPRRADELDAAYQSRLASWWAERLMALDPGELRARVMAHPLVTDAFVYPRLEPGSSNTFTLGCATVVARGAVQGDSPTNTRLLSGTDLAHLQEYLRGGEDAEGTVGGADAQSYLPVCAPIGNVSLEAIAEDSRDVLLVVTPSPTHPFPWSGSHAVVSSTTADITVAGDQSALAARPILVKLGPSYYRGGYYAVNVTTAVFGGVNTVLTLAETLITAPLGTIYPAPPFWRDLRQAMLDLFDTLSPGDSATPSRWPRVTQEDPAVLRLAAIYKAAVSVPGVSRVSITSPGANVTPTTRAQVTLGTLLVTA